MDCNPIKRNREFLGLSINELSVQAQVHRQVIIRTEQGCYSDVPPKIANYLLGRIGDSLSDLNFEYHSWVHQKRLSSYGIMVDALPPYDPARHPFILWRELSGLTRIAFCRTYCCHVSTITRFETNLSMQSVPDQLYEALTDSGYKTTLLDELSVRYKQYRRHMLFNKTAA